MDENAFEIVEETTLNEESANTEAENETETESASQDEAEVTDNAEKDSETEAEVPPQPKMTIKYNHSNVDLTQDEAVRLAQIGKRYEDKLGPIFDKLDYYATVNGKTVDDVVKDLIEKSESNYRKSLEDRVGDDPELIEEMMTLYHNKNKDKYDKAVSERQKVEAESENSKRASIESRLADEFIELKKEFPEIESFEALPKEVLKAAANTSLEHAYLKYLHNENKKISDAKTQAAKTNNASAGSLTSAEAQGDSSEESFLKGLWG